MSHFILTPFGSKGDVNPFIWIGKHLLARGHEVTLIASPVFEKGVAGAGLRFVPMGTAENYEENLKNPLLWHRWRGPELVFRFAAGAARCYFDAIQQLVAEAGCAGASRDKGVTLVGSSLAFGTRLAREKLGLPLATVHLQPSVILSAYETPVFGQGMEFLRRLPRCLKRLFFALPNPFDRVARPIVASACRELGVRPPRSLIHEWWHSPDLVLCLFPEWFAAPQPDWPGNTHLVGFPLYDLADQMQPPPEVEAFLRGGGRGGDGNGAPPVLFTPGSAMAHAHEFFAAGLAACRRLKVRALFATPYRGQLPADLPRDTVCCCDYVPFSQVLPRCAAVAHHGGIGTLSQGFAAGTPQLVMPMTHDQPDNADRLRRLGAGTGLYRSQFTAERVAQELRRLLSDPAVKTSCRSVARRIRADDAATRLVSRLETLALSHAHEQAGKAHSG